MAFNPMDKGEFDAATPADAQNADTADNEQTSDTNPADVSSPADAQSSSAQDAASTGADANQPATMEDAILAALGEPDAKSGDNTADADATDAEDEDPGDKADAKSTDADNEDGKDTKADADAGAVDEADPSDEELKGYKPGVQKRIKKLLAQRNEATTKAAGFETDATSYRGLRTFMASENLNDQEAATLFQVGADLKSGDPTRMQRALGSLQAQVQRVSEALGQTVSADLQTQIDNGDMTEEAAKRFAQERYGRQVADAKLQQQQATALQGRTEQAANEQRQSVVNSVTDWQTAIRKTDPDFDSKAELMRTFGQAMVAQKGVPKNAAEAVEYAKAIYAQASKYSKPAAPKATRPTPSASSTPKSGMTPTATSIEDIIAQGLSVS